MGIRGGTLWPSGLILVCTIAADVGGLFDALARELRALRALRARVLIHCIGTSTIRPVNVLTCMAELYLQNLSTPTFRSYRHEHQRSYLGSFTRFDFTPNRASLGVRARSCFTFAPDYLIFIHAFMEDGQLERVELDQDQDGTYDRELVGDEALKFFESFIGPSR